MAINLSPSSQFRLHLGKAYLAQMQGLLISRSLIFEVAVWKPMRKNYWVFAKYAKFRYNNTAAILAVSNPVWQKIVGLEVWVLWQTFRGRNFSLMKTLENLASGWEFRIWCCLSVSRNRCTAGTQSVAWESSDSHQRSRLYSKTTGLYWEPLWLKGLWPAMDK